MDEIPVGVVEALFRYPVKSMRGESLTAAAIGERGVVGDRTFAVREPGGRVLTAKRTRELLGWSAAFGDDPFPVDRSPVVTAPDGIGLAADDPGASSLVAEHLGRDVVLEQAREGHDVTGELDPATIFAGVPISEALAGKQRQLPDDADRYGLAPGTFFDSARLHLLTTGTLEHLAGLIGDDANTDVRRFRPNILIRTDDDAGPGFVEDGWLGRRLRIGDRVELTDVWPTLRCVMTTVRQDELPRDLRVLKTIAREHETNLGAFAAAAVAGTVRVGDRVTLVA